MRKYSKIQDFLKFYKGIIKLYFFPVIIKRKSWGYMEDATS